MRITGRRRAHRRRPRDLPPATLPRAKTGRRHDAATTRRAALVPLPGIGEKWPRTAPLRGPAIPKTHGRTSDPSQNRRLRDRRIPNRLPKKGVGISYTRVSDTPCHNRDKALAERRCALSPDR